jgi:uncharacterized protein
MKYLVLLLIVFAGIWWIRQQRQPRDDAHIKPKADTAPQTMLPCAHCGTHVPERDAVQGQQGVYCSEQHRQHKEG